MSDAFHRDLVVKSHPETQKPDVDAL